MDKLIKLFSCKQNKLDPGLFGQKFECKYSEDTASPLHYKTKAGSGERR